MDPTTILIVSGMQRQFAAERLGAWKRSWSPGVCEDCGRLPNASDAVGAKGNMDGRLAAPAADEAAIGICFTCFWIDTRLGGFSPVADIADRRDCATSMFTSRSLSKCIANGGALGVCSERTKAERCEVTANTLPVNALKGLLVLIH